MGKVSDLREIRIGIIGLGGMAGEHVKHLEKLEAVRVSAVCDTNAESVERFARKLGIELEHCHRDYVSLVADPDVDAVLSITPNDVHYRILECCLQFRKPFMTEKPFTRTYEEALDLYRQHLSDPGVPGMVGFSYRYVPSFRYARDLIRSGAIGTVRSVFVQYLQSWGVPMFGTPMNWRYERAITGTGALADLGSHMVDAARFIIGEFREVAAHLNTFISRRPDPRSGGEGTVDVDDFAGFLALLDGGVSGVFQTSRNAYGSGNQLELTIHGDLGTIKVGCEKPEELVWIRRQTESDNPSSSVTEARRVPASYELSQMQDFVDMLRGRVREELPSLVDGYENQKVLEAIIRAAEERRTVSLADISSPIAASEGAG
ncbi:Gfo/Idh/MocA family protein [Cohnella cholangitidis]|uniref:Gfo/Idh/MocA family oxidoreductase n=1 Tax=Cohnella cholangitidis TaxID=2598458 RepID=A0A7G5C1T2_9BACL|nr:Gfo/Idh/MocA family oxidoreductase [Cohnella cholangitidis]QMV43166.1 Gfo/Idh/MocA family oxidoreductase [Cohnella cholangitidis]